VVSYHMIKVQSSEGKIQARINFNSSVPPAVCAARTDHSTISHFARSEWHCFRTLPQISYSIEIGGGVPVAPSVPQKTEFCGQVLRNWRRHVATDAGRFERRRMRQ
jgi:hypothetical protein